MASSLSYQDTSTTQTLTGEIIPNKFDDVFYLGYQVNLDVVFDAPCERKHMMKLLNFLRVFIH
jgi:hypothetical protein